MKLLVVFCSTEPCKDALNAYLPLVQKNPESGLAVMDFSKTMGKDSEEANRETLRKIKEKGIPTFFFGQDHIDDLTKRLEGQTPQTLTSLMRAKRLDYGWMRDKGYLLALAARAKVVQFFDLDTVPLEKYWNILDVHSLILQEEKMAAVSGAYYGPRQITTSMFTTPEGQIGFLRLLKEMTTFDILNPPTVGGALAINLSFARKIPFPMLPEVTMSDDMLISFLADLIGWQTQQSGELVDHQHGGKLDMKTRQGQEWTIRYFKRMMSITALMHILTRNKMKSILRDRIEGIMAVPTDTPFSIAKLESFLEKLFKLAEIEGNTFLTKIITSLKEENMPAIISDVIVNETVSYLEMISSWPKIVKAVEAFGPKWVRL